MFVRLLICLLFFFCLFYNTESHIFAYSNRQTGIITCIIKIMIKVIFFFNEIKINLMFSLLFFSPFAIYTYTTFVKFRLFITNNRWFLRLYIYNRFLFYKKNIKVNYWVLLSIYIYIFTFALVLGYIAYLSKQYELVSFSFCFY